MNRLTNNDRCRVLACLVEGNSWPDRVIGKCESGALREEHNKAVNVAHDLLEACEQLIELADSGAVIDLADNDATPISRRIRAAIAKAGGASS